MSSQASQPTSFRRQFHKKSATQNHQVKTFDLGTKLIVCISDTHNEHSRLSVPEGDILIHAGDFTEHGTLEEIKKFNDWLGTLPHKHKILVAGNHDISLEKFSSVERAGKLLNNAIYLSDSEVTVDGLRIYGSPWQPKLPGVGAFYLQRGAMLASRWNKIPQGIDILVTHTPPYGVLDTSKSRIKNRIVSQSVGCIDLTARLKVVKPKLHVFGHIHEGYGVRSDSYTTYLNAANMNYDHGDRGLSNLKSLNLPLVFKSNSLLWSKSSPTTLLKNKVLSYALLAKRKGKV